MITIIFDKFISFRATDESYLLTYWGKMQKSTVEGLNFKKIQDSSFLNEMSNLSSGFAAVRPANEIKHYAIFLSYDFCIEFLSDKVPDVIVEGNKH